MSWAWWGVRFQIVKIFTYPSHLVTPSEGSANACLAPSSSASSDESKHFDWVTDLQKPYMLEWSGSRNIIQRTKWVRWLKQRSICWYGETHHGARPKEILVSVAIYLPSYNEGPDLADCGQLWDSITLLSLIEEDCAEWGPSDGELINTCDY